MIGAKQEVHSINGIKYVLTWTRAPFMPWVLTDMQPLGAEL